MLHSLFATVQGGQIQLPGDVILPEGATLLVTILPEDEDRFWLQASESSLASVWDNAEDDAYAQLLED
jgi:hypothetical protein